ncbi:MAG TPA: MerR family transcriptional regulator [Sporosarcina psychrophila]|uniref:MerR family transcriptional regulator n=1 Tax=Sporosarcina psychrophila TaxID=1476 RepID=A0A921G166_SPOPS|nr:MerR family transcriptional regulator [Sporosarcina psychrophila]
MRTLCYYDQIGLLSPSESGQRLNNKANLVRIKQIQSLKTNGLVIEEVQSMLTGRIIINPDPNGAFEGGHL